MTAATSAFLQLRGALQGAANDARRGWNRKASGFVVALAMLVLAPVVVRDPIRLAALASGLYTILSAIGLNFTVGMAGIPSLGHGAFVAVGAFAMALLRVKAGWDPTAALVAAVILSGLAGALVGAGAIRLSRPIVAIATWVVSWLVAFTLAGFPGLFGGLQGLAVPEGTLGISPLGLTIRLTPGVHCVIAAFLVALALLSYIVLSRAPWGLALAAAREEPAAAAALGVERGRLQFWTFATSAMVAGAAGAFAVQLSGVADPTAYGPLLSVELFAAVLLGGVGRSFGPVVGAAGLLAIPRIAQGLGAAVGISAERFEPAVASALLLVALVIGRGGGIAALGAEAVQRLRRPRTLGTNPVSPSVPAARGNGAESGDRLDRWRFPRLVTDAATTAGDGRPILQTNGMAKRFGGVVALDEVALDLSDSQIHAVIGPNGSGKTTLLRVVGGTLPPDDGRILFRSSDITNVPTPERVRMGLVRTLQRVNVFPGLSLRENVLVGTVARRRYGGAIRSLALTPLSRAEAKTAAAEADALLELVGLPNAATRHPKELSGAEQRFLMIASACAAFPKFLLLDEPSAGLSRTEIQRLVSVVQTVRSRGVTVVLVEHNLRLVRLLADRVTVLDAGRVIAEGTSEEISRNEAVIEAYLGGRGRI